MYLFTNEFLFEKFGKILKEDAKEQLIKEASEYSAQKQYDIFLSHSFKDASAILMLKKYFESIHYSVYVDWIDDPQLNRTNVTKKTANTIVSRMQNCRSLFFAVSANSNDSKWMPWELGYFDGFKNKVAILQVEENDSTNSNFMGREYLKLYPYVARDFDGLFLQSDLIYICENLTTYVALSDWLGGKQPYSRK